MYTVSVPLVSQTLHRSDLTALTQQLRDAGVSRIVLSIGTYIADPEKRRACMTTLGEQCAFFKAEGFQVGIWLWTIQFPEENGFAKITSVYGQVRQQEACPADPEFRAFAADYIQELAGLHPDVILFDEDALDGRLVADEGDDDIAVLRGITTTHDHDIAIENARVDHTHTRHAQSKQLACRVLTAAREGDVVFHFFYCEDGHTGRDLAE